MNFTVCTFGTDVYFPKSCFLSFPSKNGTNNFDPYFENDNSSSPLFRIIGVSEESENQLKQSFTKVNEIGISLI